jgi:Aminotransferase class-V
MRLPIYLYAHATTPVDPRVFEAMAPYFTETFGNAASRGHVFGWEAEAAVDVARERVAAAMNASEKEIIFTSGATESDNLAVLGAARHYREKGRHVVTAATEHHAVLDTCRALEREGFRVTYLVPESTGEIPLDAVAEALTDDTILVSLMLANNEIGTIQRIAEIGALCRERGVLFHTDAVQGFGKIPFDVQRMHVDLASVTGHKIYGPKGTGALYVRGRHPRVRLEPLFHGGGHERGLRSGTLNVPGIVGFGAAAELAVAGGEPAPAAPARAPRSGTRGPPGRPRPERTAAAGDRGGRVSGGGNRRAAPAGQPQPLLRRGRRRGPTRQPEGHRGLLRRGLHVGLDRAVPRAEGHRRPGRAGARVDPLRPRPADDRGGDRLRDRDDDKGGQAPARARASSEVTNPINSQVPQLKADSR